MGVDHPGRGMSIAELKRDIRRESKATIRNASVGGDGIRIHGGGWLRIENGGLSVTGSGVVSGTLTVSGRLEGDGTLEWDGPSYFNGTTTVRGNFGTTGSAIIAGSTTISGDLDVTGNATFGGSLDIDGPTQIDGATTLNSTLTVSTGQIKAGAVTITPSGGGSVKVGTVTVDGGGSTGGRVYSSDQLELTGANGVRTGGTLTTSDVIALGVITAAELNVVGPKNFRMPHPSKPGFWLRHGSTESPVSGTEYTGRAKIGANGSVVVDLPEYFEALNKPANRTVQLTPIGQPFAVGAGDVLNGKFTVYGTPGRDVFWLVKAERFGGDFLLEEEIPATEEEA
ncbi:MULTISPECIES: hypothetical protein [unclassified Microbacterium]|uniref:hypothetical protein n=1 Tax=unclassified Microbacterium TaxID=2609290 RepID=UPI000EAABD62|nr:MULTISPECIES: hypothetical protein [unclassified Microbacterium]MBT2485819.1 hypothetical protein [Microbacterium sp. ISL-108]RKN68582.1 hypothetical protein D7252_13975 [Microbacterium sp. CGR2]